MSTEIDRLVVKFDADVTQLNSKMDRMLAKQAQAAKKLEETWKKNPLGAALNEMGEDISRTATKVPGLGAALEAIGPAGLAAAVGVGAFLEVLNLGREAIEFAAAIGKGAEKIGITTTALQELRFVVEQTGGTAQEADAAMSDFQQQLGLAALGSQRAVKAFQALHLDPKKLVGEGTTKAIEDAIEALAKVPTEAQRAGLAAKTGLQAFVPAARLGIEAVRELKDEAHETGNVMDQGIIDKALEAQDKLEALGGAIKVQLQSAFAALAPLILTVAEYLAVAAKGVADFITGVVDLATFLIHAGAGAFETFTTWLDNMWTKLVQLFPVLKSVADLLHGLATEGVHSALVTQMGAPALAAIEKEFGSLAEYRKKVHDFINKPRVAGLPQTTVDPGSLAKTKPEVPDTTQKRLEEAAGLLAGAMRSRLQAELALTAGINERAVLETEIAQKEYEQQIAELEKKRADAIADKGLKDKGALAIINAEINAAKAEQAKAEGLKEEKIARDALVANINEETAETDRVVSRLADQSKAEEDHLTALASLATTTQERNRLENAAMTVRHDREAALDAALVTRTKAELEAAIAAHDPNAIKAAQDALASALDKQGQGVAKRADESTAQDVAHLGPVQAYLRSLDNLNNVIMEDGVKAIDSLADGLADAIVNAKSLKDVATNVFKQMAAELIAAFIKKEIFSAFLKVLPGMAAGGQSAGGLTLVGERGPELLNLPSGSRVIPNGSLRNVALSGGGGGSPIILFDNRGAVIWEQAARAMMGYADRSAAMAGVGAVSASRQGVPVDLARMGGRRLA